MTEKLFTGTLNHNQNKKQNKIKHISQISKILSEGTFSRVVAHMVFTLPKKFCSVCFRLKCVLTKQVAFDFRYRCLVINHIIRDCSSTPCDIFVILQLLRGYPIHGLVSSMEFIKLFQMISLNRQRYLTFNATILTQYRIYPKTQVRRTLN